MKIDTRFIINVLNEIVSNIPEHSFSIEGNSKKSGSDAQGRINKAAIQAAALSAGLAIPPGFAGFVTLIPGILAIWKLQRKLVMEIADLYGADPVMRRKRMIHCFAGHSAAQLAKDLLVKDKKWLFLKKTTGEGTEQLMRHLGIGIVKKKGVHCFVQRMVPVLGSVLAGVYAFYDTQRVGRAALEHFGRTLRPTPEMT